MVNWHLRNKLTFNQNTTIIIRKWYEQKASILLNKHQKIISLIPQHCPLMTLCLSTTVIHKKTCMVIDIANKISTLVVTLSLTDWLWMAILQSACPHLTHSLSVQSPLELPQLVMWNMLTHWGQEKMAANFLTIFSNAFSRMKIYKFRLKFHWKLFPRVQLTIFQHCFRLWLCPDQVTSHYLKQWWSVYWRIYEKLGLNELTLIVLNLIKYICISFLDSEMQVVEIYTKWRSHVYPYCLESISLLMMTWQHKQPGHQQ